MLSDSIIATIRTVVPALVGSLIAVLVNKGINIDVETQQALAAVGVSIIITLYYALVTFLERNVNSNFGWLLGQAKAPTYEAQE